MREQYQGEFADFEEELDWNDFALRSYDPQIGRWLQQDPYDEFSSPYVGMGNDPANLTDPSGGSIFDGVLKVFLKGGAGAMACPGVSQFVGAALKTGIFIGQLAVNGAHVVATVSSFNANQDFISSSLSISLSKGSGRSQVIGISKRTPGLNADGTEAEDMKSCDFPSLLGLDISQNDVAKTDKQLFEDFMDLVKWVSTGKLERVALKMIDKLKKSDGGEFTDPDLNEAVDNHSAFKAYAQKVANDFKKALIGTKGDASKVPVSVLQLPNFSDLGDKLTGLGITIHDFWAGKVEISNYEYNKNTGNFTANIKFTLYDHFGLDRADVIKNKDRFFFPPNGGRGFKAWYILQHERCYKPFVTKVEIFKRMSGNLKN